MRCTLRTLVDDLLVCRYTLDESGFHPSQEDIPTVATRGSMVVEDAAGRERPAARPHAMTPNDPGGERLRDTFRSRTISLRTMSLPLRLATVFALTQIIATAALVALRDVDMPTLRVFVEEGEPAVMPTPAFWACVLSLVAAWTYLLAGALRAHRAVSVVGLVAVTGGVYLLHQTGLPTGQRAVPLALALAAGWGFGFAVLVCRRLMRRGLLLTAPLVAFLFAATWWSTAEDGGTSRFALALAVHLASLAVGLIPVFVLAGSDWADWGDVLGERARTLATRAPGGLQAVTALVAAAIFVSRLRDDHLSFLPYIAMPAAAAVLVVCLVRASRAARQSAHGAVIPYPVLVAAAIVIFGLIFVFIQWGTRSEQALPGTIGGERHIEHDRPAYSIETPAGWEVEEFQVAPDGTRAQAFRDETGLLQLWVVSKPGGDADALSRFLGRFGDARPEIVARGSEGRWTTSSFSLSAGAISGYAWQQEDEGVGWLVFGLALSALGSKTEGLFAALHGTWASGATSPPSTADESAGSRPLGFACIVAILITAAAAASLVGQRRSGRPRLGLLFAAIAGILFVLSTTRDAAHLLLGLDPDVLPGLPPAGIQTFVALATLAVLAASVGGRRGYTLVGPLLTLNVGLQALVWIGALLERQSDVSSRFTLAQALLLLLAILWDVTMSGSAITNADGHIFPRSARVLLFFGYVMLVTSGILFFSSARVEETGAATELQFDSDLYPRLGLTALGIPLLVTLFLARVLRRPEAPETIDAR